MPRELIGLGGVVMPYLLEMKNITKTFGSVKAVSYTHLDVYKRQVVGERRTVCDGGFYYLSRDII